MPGPIIRAPISCSKCGYDLEGLDARTHCPECGQDIVVTLAARLDPATERLDRSRGLHRIAWAVSFASIGTMLGCAIAVPPVLASVRAKVELPRWLAPGVEGAISMAPAVAVIGSALGFIALVFILPWGRRRALLRARSVGGLGFAGWLVLSLLPPSFEVTLASLGAVAAVVASLTPLLRELVPFSRIYRTARHATQTTRELIIASATTLGAGVVALHMHRDEVATEWVLLAAVTAYSSAMFLLVGLGYRLTNALWALRSVRRPAPRVEEILGE